MTPSIVISIIALIISIAGISTSIYFGQRDRPRIVTSSNFLPQWEENTPHVNLVIVNAGRRPIILRMWAGAESKTNWVGTFLEKEKNGLRLGEHERHEFKIERNELLATTPTDDVPINDIWFEDTLGRRHFVKDAKANIAKLWAT